MVDIGRAVSLLFEPLRGCTPSNLNIAQMGYIASTLNRLSAIVYRIMQQILMAGARNRQQSLYYAVTA